MPPPIANRAKMDAAEFRCPEVSVMNISIISMTSMIRCWLGVLVQVVYLGVKVKVPKGWCRRFNSFSSKNKPSTAFCQQNVLRTSFFYVGAIEFWCSLDETAVRSKYANCPDGQNLEIWKLCECFCPWTHFHKSTPALCNASFVQFRLRKVGCSGSSPQRWQANPERSMPWHPWDQSRSWWVRAEKMPST